MFVGGDVKFLDIDSSDYEMGGEGHKNKNITHGARATHPALLSSSD